MIYLFATSDATNNGFILLRHAAVFSRRGWYEVAFPNPSFPTPRVIWSVKFRSCAFSRPNWNRNASRSGEKTCHGVGESLSQQQRRRCSLHVYRRRFPGCSAVDTEWLPTLSAAESPWTRVQLD